MLNGRLRNGSQSIVDQGEGRPGQGRQGRLLDRGRRPVQGLAGLRRAALRRVRRQAPGAAGPHADHAHPAARRAALARWSRCTAPAARSPTATASRWPTSGSTLPDSGRWTSTDADGRFLFDRLTPGRHRLLARTADGREVVGRPRGAGRAAGPRPRRTARPPRAAGRAASADDRTGSRRCPIGSCRRQRGAGEACADGPTPAGPASCSGTSDPSCEWGCAGC